MSRYTLDTSARTVIGAIIIQGLGFSSLFVPLTAVALSTIPRYRLADATGLNSLLRQIGGSLGLATFATLLPKFTAVARNALAAHLPAGSPMVLERIGMVQRGLAARGFDTASAQARRARAGRDGDAPGDRARLRAHVPAGRHRLPVHSSARAVPQGPTGARAPKPTSTWRCKHHGNRPKPA